MSRNCCDCDYFFTDFCDLYEKTTDPFDTCDEFACMEADYLWNCEEDDEYLD